MRKIPFRLFFITLVILVSGCSLAPSALDATGQAFTSIALASVAATQTITPTATLSGFTTETSATQTPEITRSPSYPQNPSPTMICNRASPGTPIDISVPDDTVFSPGEMFSKTWRLQNSGACVWSSDYSIVFFSGDPLGAARTSRLNDTVEPGQTVDITIDMIAPEKAGIYQSNWVLSDDHGKIFGLGPGGDAPFWVRIDVVAPDTPTPTSLPTKTATPTPAVYSSGLSNMVPDDTIDLDSDMVNSSSSADLSYSIQNNETHLLTPLNGAAISIFGMAAPTNKDCSSATLDTSPISIDAIDQGTYLCYSTDMGLPGWLRLVALNTQDNTLTLEILTWAIP